MTTRPADQTTLEPGIEGITVYAAPQDTDVYTAPSSRSVQWVRQSDGALIAKEVAIARSSNEVEHNVASIAPTENDTATLRVTSTSQASAPYNDAEVVIVHEEAGAIPRNYVLAIARDKIRRLVDDDGRSDYLQADDNRTRITGQKQVHLGGMGANAYYEPVINLPINNPSFYTIVGGFIPRDFMEYVRWCWSGVNASQFQFRFWNSATGWGIPNGSYFTYNIIYGLPL